jgi:hypothetical protein
VQRVIVVARLCEIYVWGELDGKGLGSLSWQVARHSFPVLHIALCEMDCVSAG